MTPGARVAAAIEIMENVLGGTPVERALTTWSRGSRYAGSKDRAAVRDHVFDALRCLRSAAWTGGVQGWPEAGQGRAVIAGSLILQDIDPAELFTGEGHAPVPLEPFAAPDGPMPDAVRLDVQDWILATARADLDDADTALAALRERAPVYLRTNLTKITPDALIMRLAEEGVIATPDAMSPSALRLEGVPRGLTNLVSFEDGLWELQDAGSQALVDRLPLDPEAQILDLCAGGGGKALAFAGRGAGAIMAFDADHDRMRDLPARTRRAAADVTRILSPEDHGPFDGVIADVPCTGSGSWRRAPDAKWRLTEARLAELMALQDEILARAISVVRPGGWVAYMTCSIFAAENEDRVDAALARDASLALLDRWSCLPVAGRNDGFHLSLVERRS